MNRDGKINRALCAAAIILLIASLMPVMYCALSDYATGDDFGKSYMVRRVIKNGGNIIEILKAGADGAYEAYVSNEGTWASNFILAMQPGVWGERVYAVTPFIGLFFLGIGTGMFIYELMVRVWGFSKRAFWFLWPLFFALMIQCMPYIKGGLFWHPGMAHYDIPFAAALIFTVWMMRYFRTGKKKYVPLLLLISVYLGGSHYQAMLLGWLSLVFLAVYAGYAKKTGRGQAAVAGLCVLIQFVGFYFCYKAPGNNARAEAQFSFTAERAVDAVKESVIQSSADGIGYLAGTRWVFIFAVLVFMIGAALHDEQRFRGPWKYAVWIVYSYLTYCAMYAPGLYYNTYGAALDLSGGYYDVNYYTFLLFVLFAALLTGNAAGNMLGKKSFFAGRIRGIVNAGMVCIAVFCVLFNRHLVGRTTDRICADYITSGALADFRVQMEERLAILEDDSIRDAVVPQMNDDQGPIMHMALTEDRNAFTNWAASLYYGKDSIVAVPRDEYCAQ